MIKMILENEGVFYEPVLVDSLTYATSLRGVPGALKFSVLSDGVINFQEGNNLTVSHNDKPFFNGFCFTKERSDGRLIKVTAYDQLRYLKNKDTFSYDNITAGELIETFASVYGLRAGDIDDTGHKILSIKGKNKTLFDIINKALDRTLQNKNQLYVLYDDIGRLTLKNIEAMKLDLVIDSDSAQGFSYTSSIDKDTYNKIKLVKEDEGTSGGIDKEADDKEFEDKESIKKWGVLQLTENLKKGENPIIKAQTLLSLHNKKTRTLSVKKAFGDIRVRAGSLVGVSLDLGDIIKSSLMLVEKCTHTFKEDTHTMDLVLRGGGIDV